MRRCNKPATVWYTNGFRCCPDCLETVGFAHIDGISDKPVGPCDNPTESKAQFRARRLLNPED